MMKQTKQGVLVAPATKWKSSTKAEKRKAAKDKIKNAYAEEAKVEVIPAIRDLTAYTPKILRVAYKC